MELNASLGTGFKAAGCRGCGNVFTTVRNFDSHQRLTREGLVCLDPVSVGLERKRHGRWGMPGRMPLADSAVEVDLGQGDDFALPDASNDPVLTAVVERFN